MGYKLFDKNNNELQHHNLQDKHHWCRDGEKIEEAFIRLFGNSLNLIINPEKKENPFAPDLLNVKTNKLGDLKLQSTPFFKAQSLYNINPTFAVVFNQKDKIRYERKYPHLEIYYWINWIALKFQMGNTVVSVEPINGVWQVDFPIFNQYLDKSSLHSYQQRISDTRGNAKSSFVCDIRNAIFKRVI